MLFQRLPSLFHKLWIHFLGVLFLLLHGSGSAQPAGDSLAIWTQEAADASSQSEADARYDKILNYHHNQKDSVAWRRSYVDLAYLYDDRGWTSPMSVLEKALSQIWWATDRNTAYLYTSLGYFARQEGKSLRAVEVLEAIYQWMKVGTVPRNGFLVYEALRPLGNTYTELGEYQKARLVLEDGLRYYESLGSEANPAEVALMSSDLGLIYFTIGDFSGAEKQFQQALELERTNPLTRFTLLINLASTLQETGQYAAANRAMGQAAEELKLAPKDDALAYYHASLASARASLYQYQRQYSQAMFAINQAISFGKIAYPATFSRELAKLYLQRAALLGVMGRPLQGLEDCQHALEKLLLNHRPVSVYSQGNHARYVPENRLWETFSLQTELFTQSYQTEKNPRYLSAALEAAKAALEVEALQLKIFAYDESSLTLLASNRLQKIDAVKLAWERYRLSPSKEAFFDALSLAERSRSLLLQDRKLQLELLEGKQADPYLVRSLERVDALLATTQIALRSLDNQSPAFIQEERNLDSLVNQRQQIKEQLQRNAPLYAATRFGDLSFSLDELQRQLPPNVLVASYFMGENEVFLFGITNKDVAFLSIPVLDSLSQHINRLSEAVTLPYMGRPSALDMFDNQRKQLSFSLYESLLYPLLQEPGMAGKERLWVIPDGIIGRVPFALLHTEQTASRYYAEEPFLVKKFALGMANNLTLLHLQLQASGISGEANMLCVAPSYQTMAGGSGRSIGPDQLNLPVPQGVRLVFHLQEAQFLHNRYGGGYLYEREANPTRFLEEVEQYSLLHFSGHAQPDSATGVWNYLALESEAGDLEAFSPFWQPKILALRLNAQMVYLSACETSRGKLYAGEGHSSLARAFLYAGASSVVATLWQIDDSVSLRFAQRFYLNLEEQVPKDLAMQRTMLSMIEENRPPYAWAPYLLWGNTEGISLQKRQPRWPWYLGIGAALSIVGWILYGRWRRTRAV